MIRIALYALALLLALGTTAHAGILVPIIIGAAAAATTAGVILTAVVNIAFSIGASYLASKLIKPDEPTFEEPVGGVQLDLKVDADVPQVLILGRAVTAGSLAYAELSGPDNDLVDVYVLADHPCTQLVEFYTEGQLRTASSVSGDTDGLGFYVDQYGNSPGPRAFFRPYLGTQTIADPILVDRLSSAELERPWSADNIFTSTTYVRTYVRYHPELIPSPFKWKFVVDGIKLYDPRLDSTVGGSGSHRFDDLDTHEFTQNPAVMIYNILRGIRVKDYQGTAIHFYGLENTPAANLPLANWFAAMNECDVDIDGEPQFFAGAEVSVDTEPHATIKELLKTCDGKLTEVGGIYKMRVGAPSLPAISFEDGDLLASESDSFKPILPQTQRVNYVTGKYTSPTEGWVPKVAPPRNVEEWETEDRKRIFGDLDAPMVQSGRQMQQLMQQMLNRGRRQRRHVIPLGPAAFGIEPGDFVEWTSVRNGYVEKLFEVDGVDIHPNATVTIALTEVDPDDYDFDPNTDVISESYGSIGVVRPPPPPITAEELDPDIGIGSINAANAGALQNWLTWLSEQVTALSNQASGQYALLEQRDNLIQSGISVRVGSAEASVTNLQQVTATADAALALSITAVSASFNGFTANGTFRATAAATPDGAVAAVDLQVRADSSSAWAAAGIQLAAYTGDGGAYARTRMYADSIEFGDIESEDGEFVKVFEVSNVNGIRKLAFKSSALPDDVVDSRSLVPGSDVERFVVESATITRTASQWYNSGSGNTVITGTLPVLDDEALEVMFRAVLTMSLTTWNQTSTNIVRGTFKCYVNDLQVDETVDWGSTPYAAGGLWFQTTNQIIVTIPFLADDLTAGDATVRIEFALDSSASPESQNFSIIRPKLFIHRVKRPLITYISQTPVTTDAVYIDTYVDTSGSPASFGVFSDVAIGDADPNRILVVALGWVSTSSTSPTLTVDGQTARLVCDVNAPTTRRLNIYSIPKTTGATADIVANLPTNATDCFISIVNMTVNSVSALVQNDSYGGADAGMNFPSYADAIGIVAVYTDDGATGITLSSTTGTVTELVDALNDGGDGRLAMYKIAYGVTGGASVVGTGIGATQHNIAGGVWR